MWQTRLLIIYPFFFFFLYTCLISNMRGTHYSCVYFEVGPSVTKSLTWLGVFDLLVYVLHPIGPVGPVAPDGLVPSLEPISLCLSASDMTSLSNLLAIPLKCDPHLYICRFFFSFLYFILFYFTFSEKMIPGIISSMKTLFVDFRMSAWILCDQKDFSGAILGQEKSFDCYLVW